MEAKLMVTSSQMEGGVQALRTVLISVSLCLYPAEALYPLF